MKTETAVPWTNLCCGVLREMETRAIQTALIMKRKMVAIRKTNFCWCNRSWGDMSPQTFWWEMGSGCTFPPIHNCINLRGTAFINTNPFLIYTPYPYPSYNTLFRFLAKQAVHKLYMGHLNLYEILQSFIYLVRKIISIVAFWGQVPH